MLQNFCNTPFLQKIGAEKEEIFIKFVDFFEKVRIILSRMETHRLEAEAGSNVTPELTRQNMVVGAKQIRKALQNGRANRVYLAQNADPAITEPLEALCLQYHIDYAWVPNKLDLGKACGIEVGAAAAAALN